MEGPFRRYLPTGGNRKSGDTRACKAFFRPISGKEGRSRPRICLAQPRVRAALQLATLPPTGKN